MTRATDDRREEVLTHLMVEYDEALLASAPTRVVDESIVDFDPRLAQEWDELKRCIGLLDRARRLTTDRPVSASDAPQDQLDSDSGPDIRSTRRLGRFLVKRELGRGGLGIVYLAHDPQLRRDIAIKVPRSEALLDDAMRRRFLREAEAAARLSHPHLVTLLEVGQDGPVCYLTSEYCPGPTLAQWLSHRRQAVPVGQAAAAVLTLAEAVEHAHSRGVLHRDIKPSNVLLGPIRPSDNSAAETQLSGLSPKLTDFGMAKLLEQSSSETRTGAIIGTVAYMSPEQAEGRVDELDARTDVYALGAILYELLTGAAPYAGKTDLETLRQLIINAPIAPRRVRREVPRDLEAITLKCLAKCPADRYATAHELSLDLKRFLAGQQTMARPLTWWEHSGKWARQRPAAAALLATVCLAALGFMGLSTAFNARLTSSLDATRSLLYATDMQAGFDAWQRGTLLTAQERLDRHVPADGRQELRTFPWRLLRQFSTASQREIYRHPKMVTAVAYSPDGKWIASAERDGAVQLWDTKGSRLAVRLQGHLDDVNDLAFSPDSRLLASAGDDQVVRIWEIGSGGSPRILSDFSNLAAYGVAFSPDGTLLAVACEDARVRLWDTRTWAQSKTLTGHTGPVRKVIFFPDGLRVASCSQDGNCRVNSLASDAAVTTFAATAKGPDSHIISAFSSDGSVLATSGWSDRTVRFWSTESGELIDSGGASESSIRSLAFSPDDRWLVAGTRNGCLWVIDRTANYTARHRLGHISDLRGFAFSPDGRSLITGGGEGGVKAWNMAMIEKSELRHPTTEAVSAVALHPSESLLAYADDSDSVTLVDSRSGKVIQRIDNRAEGKAGAELRSELLIFSNDGKLLAYSAKDRSEVHVYDLNQRAIAARLVLPNARVAAIAFGVGSRELFTVSDNSYLTRWDLATAQPLATCDMRQPEPFAVRLLGGGGIVMTAAKDGICLRNAETLAVVGELSSYPQPLRALAVSADESLLAAGATTGELVLWDLPTRELKAVLAGHLGGVNAIGFSPDGSTLVSCDLDLTLRLWDVRVMHEVGCIPVSVNLNSVAFSPDGNSILAGGSRTGGGAVHLWSPPSESNR